jgi:hypothetical protein
MARRERPMFDELTGEIIKGVLFLCCCVLSVAICMVLTDKEQNHD